MKKLQIAFLSGILLSLFSITSCSPGADPVMLPVLTPETTTDSDENKVTVTFNDNGYIIETVQITSGEKISYLQKPANPGKSYNWFLYWSESKASQATAVEFDFNTPITENKTLYAIYCPKFYYSSSSIIQTVSATQVEIKISDTSVYPLEDGSYAGISFQHSTNGSEYQAFAVNSPKFEFSKLIVI